MEITLEKLDSKKIQADSLVIADYTGDKRSSKILKELDEEFEGYLSEAIESEEFKFELASCFNIRIPRVLSSSVKNIVLLGLGDKVGFGANQERKAIAAGVRAVAKSSNVAFVSIKDPALVAEIAVLVTYSFDKYKNKKEADKKISNLTILANSTAKKEKDAAYKAQVLANGVNKARDLVWEPACAVTPSVLAKEALKISEIGLSKKSELKKKSGIVANPKSNISVKVLDREECDKLGMGAYLAVAQGSDEPPKFIHISYEPKGKIKKHLTIVGKGVTFDSGGLSLKPPKSMEMMKEDMSGSAAVIGLFNIIAELQPKGVKLTGIIAATENMPSGKAYRPGDVITAMNGKTIEVNNTDAEGRLTLADAVYYASLEEPDEIIDIATLTGACMVALGNVCAGLMTNDAKMCKAIQKSAEKQGELMWELPLYKEYEAKLKSPIADLLNAGSGGQAGAQNGGLFVREFVGKASTPGADEGDHKPSWTHIDIAGPCWLDEENSWSPKGASGIPVRTLWDYIQNI